MARNLQLGHVCKECTLFKGEDGCSLHGKDRSDHYDSSGSVPPCHRRFGNQIGEI